MSTTPLRHTPLDERHRALGATMAGFGGWEMPIDYGSVVAEHQAVRNDCGVFDLSHLGTLRVTGADGETCVQRTFTNDAAALPPGRAHYTLCLNEEGGIEDDLLVYRLGWGFFVVPNAANTVRVRAALETSAVQVGEAHVDDTKDAMACLAVQGPRAEELLAAVGVETGLEDYFDCRVYRPDAPGQAQGVGDAGDEVPNAGVLARTGYTGERGYEIFLPADHAGPLWDRLVDAGAAPVGLGARDTLRLEMGLPLHGQDLTPETSPVEARLGWAVKPGTGFVGEQAYLAAKDAGPSRRLWGLHATGRGIPRPGFAVMRDDEQVGDLSSGGYSPTLRTGIGMGYLDKSVDEGDAVAIDVRGKPVPAEVMRPPFVSSSPK